MTKQRLLIVEDDAVNINLLTGLLHNEYQISIARTMKRALEIISDKHIDLILLDLNLPDGSGFDLCEKVKQNEAPFTPPLVIVMTGSVEAEEECFKKGANEFIAKPFNKGSFLARLSLQSKLLDKLQS